MLEERIVSEGVSAASSGNVGLFGRIVDTIDRGIQSAIINASTAGELHVELEKLTSFYNALATLHTDHLQPRMTAVLHRATAATGQHAGGHVPGLQAAWRSITHSAGAMNTANSLYGNLQAVDNLVLSHMNALYDTAQHYAAQENQAIAGFGHVNASSPHSTSSASSGW
jgi:hypothetical protein